MCCQVNDGTIIKSTKIENILPFNNGVESPFSHSLIDEHSLKNGRNRKCSALISAISRTKMPPILWLSSRSFPHLRIRLTSIHFTHFACVCEFLFALNSCFSPLKIDCKLNLEREREHIAASLCYTDDGSGAHFILCRWFPFKAVLIKLPNTLHGSTTHPSERKTCDFSMLSNGTRWNGFDPKWRWLFHHSNAAPFSFSTHKSKYWTRLTHHVPHCESISITYKIIHHHLCRRRRICCSSLSKKLRGAEFLGGNGNVRFTFKSHRKQIQTKNLSEIPSTRTTSKMMIVCLLFKFKPIYIQ